jgi:hypothetical protein
MLRTCGTATILSSVLQVRVFRKGSLARRFDAIPKEETHKRCPKKCKAVQKMQGVIQSAIAWLCSSNSRRETLLAPQGLAVPQHSQGAENIPPRRGSFFYAMSATTSFEGKIKGVSFAAKLHRGSTRTCSAAWSRCAHWQCVCVPSPSTRRGRRKCGNATGIICGARSSPIPRSRGLHRTSPASPEAYVRPVRFGPCRCTRPLASLERVHTLAVMARILLNAESRFFSVCDVNGLGAAKRSPATTA